MPSGSYDASSRNIVALLILRVELTPLHAFGSSILLLALLGMFKSTGDRIGPATLARSALDLLGFLVWTFQDFEIGGREIALASLTRSALPPFTGITGRVALVEDGNQIALACLKLHAGVGLWEEIVEKTAEFEFGRVDGLL